MRLDRFAVDVALPPFIDAGQVATCGMVELEVLDSARSPDDYARRQHQLRDGFEQLAMPDEVWRRALEVQAALARKSAHRGAALPDRLMAATAERHSVTVLHYDHEYDLIAFPQDEGVGEQGRGSAGRPARRCGRICAGRRRPRNVRAMSGSAGPRDPALIAVPMNERHTDTGTAY